MKGQIGPDLEDTLDRATSRRKGSQEDPAQTDVDENNVLEMENFESLMFSIEKTVLKGQAKSQMSDGESDNGRAFRTDELFDSKRQAKMQAENKEIERSFLKNAVSRNGFIRFGDYTSKLKMMDTALFLFGLKLHRQEENIKFYDADFLNTI